MSSLRARWIGLAALALSSACSDDGGESSNGVGVICSADLPCPEGLECRDGTCAETCQGAEIPCGDRCCGSDQLCRAGACVDPSGCASPCGTECCGDAEECFDGACVPGCPTPRCGGVCCDEGDACIDGSCCPSSRSCGGVCCDGLEVCDSGICKPDCGGGVPACGGECCAAEQTCVGDRCVTLGPECQASGCATRPGDLACGDDQICDPGLGRCIPVDAAPECVFVPPVGVFDPVPLLSWGVRRERACDGPDDCQKAEDCVESRCEPSWPHVTPAEDDLPEHHQVTSIPMVTDLDADCVPEIVFNTFRDSEFTEDGVLRAIRGDDGTRVWTVADPEYRTDSTANPAIGDVDGDGSPEVFVTTADDRVIRIAADGTPQWRSDAWSGAHNSGSVTLANLDAAGDAEIVVGSVVFDSEGNLLFEGGLSRGIAGQGPISCVADLDGDERPELIAGPTVYAFSGRVDDGTFTGSVREDANIADGYCGIADFTGDGAPEIVIVGEGEVTVLHGQTLEVLGSASLPGGGNGGAPNIADFDGDGAPEIGTAGAENYLVYELDDGLVELWRAPTEDDSSSRTGSSVFDFDGDGRAEVVYNDEEFVRIYPGVEPDCREDPPGDDCDGVMTDAEILFRDLNSSRTRTEYPVIADVDGDFKAELVFATSNEAGFLDPALLGDAGIEVWADRLDNWVPTRPVWNQHSYHITNVGLLGEIPRVEAPSWASPPEAPFNSYRRNAQGDRETFCAPDLVVRDLEQDRRACPILEVVATVINQGCLGVGPGVPVVLRDEAGGILGTASTPVPLGPGSGVEIRIRVDFSVAYPASVVAEVDVDPEVGGRFNECREDNNLSEEIVTDCRIDL